MSIKDQAYQLHKNGLSYKQIGNKLEISKTRAYEYVKEMKLLNSNTSNECVQNVSEPEKRDDSEQKKNIVPTGNEVIPGNIKKDDEEIIVPAKSELQKNDCSEQDKRQKSKPETANEKPAKKSQEVKTFSGDDLVKKIFATYNYSGSKFYDLIGCPSKPFSGLVFGLPKSGKSYFCVFFADYMQEYHCETLYIAAEEGESVTLQKKFKAINGSKVTVLPTRDREVIRNFIKSGRWKLVFIDSINNAGIDNDFLELIKAENPSISFVAVCQATKAGNFKGDQALTHNCDFIIEVVDGVAKHTGRFNGMSEVNIFDEPLYEKNTSAIDIEQPENQVEEIEIDQPIQEEQPEPAPVITDDPPCSDDIQQVLCTDDISGPICSIDLVKLKFPQAETTTGHSDFKEKPILNYKLIGQLGQIGIPKKQASYDPLEFIKAKPVINIAIVGGAFVLGGLLKKWLSDD